MASLPPKPPPPASPFVAPLPPGWTEHKAPTGHSYYYNASTKESTYKRPTVAAPPPPIFAAPQYPQHPQYPTSTFDRQPGAPYIPYHGPAPGHQLPHRPYFQDFHGARGGHRGGRGRPPPPPKPQDRPKKKRAITGAEPWVLVTTKMGRTFVHNPDSKISLWAAPKDVQEKIDAMPPVDKEQEKRERAERRARRAAQKAEVERVRIEEARNARLASGEAEEAGPSSKKPKIEDEQQRVHEDAEMQEAVAGEEEEEEGEEDEEEEEEEEEEPRPNQPPAAQEFTEEDIAWQLEAMAEEYGLAEEDFEEGEELAPEESIAMFRQMLDEYGISPYSTWDDALPKIVDDQRYTVIDTTKARKDIFTAWCKERSAQLREEKEKAQKVDPRIPFWGFLKERSTSKLFWMEFKRKWRKEPVMKDSKLSDKEREKMYRDFVARNKTSESIREVDLKKLLKSVPSLSKQTTLLSLPDSILVDVRYVTAPESSRDRIITDYLSTLPDAPISEEERKAKEERERRDRALREREWQVRKEKRLNAADEAMARQILREEEAAIERAKQVSKKGLLGHLRKEKDEPPASTTTSEEL